MPKRKPRRDLHLRTRKSEKRTAWKKVSPPKYWNPVEEGEELVGDFAGIVDKEGPHGPYRVATVVCEDDEVFQVGGTVAMSLFSNALHRLTKAPLVKVVFKGWVPINDYQYRDYELYTT